MSTAHLEKELATYERHKSELLAQGEGKFVVIQGDRTLGTWDTFEDAVKAGYATFGAKSPFLVKQVSTVDQVHFVTRDF
jgi:hypothetical protein